MAGTRRIAACRLCAATDLDEIIDFGEVPLGNNLQLTSSAARAAARYPLDLCRCAACGHFQLGHAVAPEALYATNYTYLSGIGPSFIRHFDAYADWVVATCGLAREALVVDVGSNDGTCLKALAARGFRVCGVDPAALPAKIANESGIDTINAFFDSKVVDRIKAKYGAADFVTSHNVLAHVDDLGATFANIHALLKAGGLFCFEVGYFREVLKNNFFDTIYHEHLDYHHAAPLVRHLTALGFGIEDISVNPVQGGSIRLLCRKADTGTVSASAQAFLVAEQDTILNDRAYLKNWRHEIEGKIGRFRATLHDRARQKRSIAGFGAPTKATLLMQMAAIGHDDIAYVAEDNALKAGRFLPGTGVPIVPTSHLLSNPPDVLVIFAWNFADDIVSNIRGKLGKPVEVIIPLPEAKTVQL
jgi:2-polyprenyl-3-methyl-5-hydroxy-6-metoxy-1,4-benzoquinol methylase